jgi:hypothetical protein
VALTDNIETADLYNYRKGLRKAKLIGAVSQQLKIHAIDCNLRRDATVIQNLSPRDLIDSHGVTRSNIDVNDTPYTALCDWLETCDYKCSPLVDLSTIEKNT